MTQDKTIRGVLQENITCLGCIKGGRCSCEEEIDQALKEIKEIMVKDKAELLEACKEALSCLTIDLPCDRKAQTMLRLVISNAEKGGLS